MKLTSALTGAAILAGSLGFASGGAEAVATSIPVPETYQQAPTQQLTGSATPTQVVGDFNGDKKDDVFWYVPGTTADIMWFGRDYDPANSTTKANRFTVSNSYDIDGTYIPIAGDFNGDAVDDIFWYAPGPNEEHVWYFNTSAGFTNTDTSISGTYTPIVGNFDSTDASNTTEQDDIFWYSASGGTSSLWSGNTNNTFSGLSYGAQVAPANARVFAGNFRHATLTNLTVNLDLMFYVPGTGADSIWAGDGTGAMLPTSMTVNGTYTPIVGNFDDNGSTNADVTDVFWYAPGPTGDRVWMNTGAAFVTTESSVQGTYTPTVIPTAFATESILWNNLSGADRIWDMDGSNGSFEPTSYELSSLGLADPGARRPIIGDFDRVSSTILCSPTCVTTPGWTSVTPDVLWFKPGDTTAAKETLWLEF